MREYARAEAVAAVDVRAQLDLSNDARRDYHDRATRARQTENEAQATAGDDLTRRLDARRERLQVADAARREWEQASAAKAEAASQARSELDARGHERQAKAAEAREVQADAPAAGPQAETETRIDEPGHQAGRPEPAAEAEAGAWLEARAEMAADVDPEALTVMAEADADMAAIDSRFDDNLARAQAGAEQLAAQRARDQAERDRAAVDEPVMQGDVQAELEATAIEEAEAGQDTDLEI